MEFELPDFSVGVPQAAELPVIANQDIDIELLERGGGLAFAVIDVCQGLEIGGIFAADDVGLRVDAGFQGIHGGSGLALNGAGAGGFLGN